MRWRPWRLLVAILTVAVLGLVPQPGWAIGVETLLLAGGVLILLVGRLRHLGRSVEQRRFRNVPAVVLAAFALPLAAAGLIRITPICWGPIAAGGFPANVARGLISTARANVRALLVFSHTLQKVQLDAGFVRLPDLARRRNR